MGYLDIFRKEVEQEGGSEPPRYWFSTGNYVLNRILSGSFMQGIPQGRVCCYTGPSGSGKSFLVCNAMREAQAQGATVVVIDSEHALDKDFVKALGVKIDDSYVYAEIETIPQLQQTVSSLIKGYKEDRGDDPSAGDKLLIVVDSLDMLMTETEEENFDKGILKGDQGQRSKQLKAVMRQFVQAIKHDNISILVTAQVYKNQDVLNGEGVWIVSDAIKFSLSHIALLTKLKLRVDGIAKGIKLKAEGYKTRFTQPFQTVQLEVPYETGMDPFNGLVEVAVELGVLDKRGSRLALSGEDTTFYQKDITHDMYQDILVKCEAKTDVKLQAVIVDADEDTSDSGLSAKAKRAAKKGVKK
jgi:recombination protein RecA